MDHFLRFLRDGRDNASPAREFPARCGSEAISGWLKKALPFADASRVRTKEAVAGTSKCADLRRPFICLLVQLKLILECW